jgi:hypothetical protein
MPKANYPKILSCAEFNKMYPIGSKFRYHPIIGQPKYELVTTRSEAWELNSQHTIVKVNGRAGGVSIHHLEPVEYPCRICGAACADEICENCIPANHDPDCQCNVCTFLPDACIAPREY